MLALLPSGTFSGKHCSSEDVKFESDKIREKDFKRKEGRFKLDMKQQSFTQQVARHRHRLFEEESHNGLIYLYII